MQISVNGDSVELAEGTSLLQLIEHLQLSGSKIAVELNHHIVPRSQHSSRTLQHQDQVEIVHAIGGG